MNPDRRLNPVHYVTFLESLQAILDRAKNVSALKLEEIFHFLSGRGYAALLVLLSLPMCFPLHIPGMSTPFGILLAFLGFRLAFAKKLWWPHWILNKEISSDHVGKAVNMTIKGVKWSQKVIRPRFLPLTASPIAHRLNGIFIFFLAVLLAIPLPIPFTHLIAAVPIFLISLALLEDDGVVLLIGYTLGLLAFVFFFELFLFGKHHMHDFHKWFGV